MAPKFVNQPVATVASESSGSKKRRVLHVAAQSSSKCPAPIVRGCSGNAEVRISNCSEASDQDSARSLVPHASGCRPHYTRSFCDLCGPPKLSQMSDPVTKKRYCCICIVDVRSDPVRIEADVDMDAASSTQRFRRCFACLSEDTTIQYACEIQSSGCCSTVHLCVTCFASRSKLMCPMCWVSSCDKAGKSRSCYRCEGFVEAVSLAESRLCSQCRTSKLTCYFCARSDEDVDINECSYAGASCLKKVSICVYCMRLHSQAVCGKCWSVNWKSRCFKCKVRFPQQGCGRFCIQCHGLHMDEERNRKSN